MHALRLRHLFSRALRASLATPLVLAGCGSTPDDGVDGGTDGRADLTGYSQIACSGNGLALDALTISPAPDFVQLRYLYTYFGSDERDSGPVSSQGQPCATATDAAACQGALENAVPSAGFHHTCTELCADFFLVTTRGDEVKTYATPESLKSLLGTVDTAQEAVLLAFAAGNTMSCSQLERGAVKQDPNGGFNVIGTQGYACGKNTALTQHVVRVSTSGEVREVERHVLEKGSDACAIGRRPVGLQDAAACESTDALGHYFAEAAHLEAASVHAFLRLREELALHGADAGLQDAARRSAMDEVLHTDVTGRIARRFGATPQRPVVAPLPLRPLLDVALDNAVEGCVRETYGALVAHHQALHAQDAEVREAMVRIAEDETRHAGLSWDIDQWARPRLSPQERDALREAQRQAVATLRAEVLVALDPGLVTAAGLPAPEVALGLLDTLEQELWA
ncbi:ferritin-like domain-containing protein [Corallococcus sp. BB11-1]|uniref:ferritin-like domain-containing protein n=1 Tax=Corallococcus sp. BB11-1 TaxID=2996783 RepID=UPI0010DBAE3B|nr:ferritin-like domain-containing protein [Corallococcus sp. BB11-1]MCY1036491.1 ferritin-like domain-containing protein [Corallococcus sp. BB11-1]RYZ46960.1 MAG: ferritin-like domain-containing protein [Myxococcaceae bacterium]